MRLEILLGTLPAVSRRAASSLECHEPFLLILPVLRRTTRIPILSLATIEVLAFGHTNANAPFQEKVSIAAKSRLIRVLGLTADSPPIFQVSRTSIPSPLRGDRTRGQEATVPSGALALFQAAFTVLRRATSVVFNRTNHESGKMDQT